MSILLAIANLVKKGGSRVPRRYGAKIAQSARLLMETDGGHRARRAESPDFAGASRMGVAVPFRSNV
jgi:hypothetical protein